MSGRPAAVRQRDVKQILNAVRQAGVKDITIHVGDASFTINLATMADDKPSVQEDEEVTL